MRNGRRKLKTEAEVICGLLTPALDNLGFRQGVKRGVALHTVKVAGILFKAGDPQPHPFRMRPLRQTDVNHNAWRISSTLRTRAMRG